MSNLDVTMDNTPEPTLSEKLEKLYCEGETLVVAVFEAYGTEDEAAALKALNEWGPVEAQTFAFVSVTEDGDALILTDTDDDVYEDYNEVYTVFVWQPAIINLWDALIEAATPLQHANSEAPIQAGDNAPWQSFLEELNLLIQKTGLEDYSITSFAFQDDYVLLIDSDEKSFASAEDFLKNLEWLIDEGDEDFAGLPTIFEDLYAEGAELFAAVMIAFEKGDEEGAAQALALLNAWGPIAESAAPLVAFGLDEDPDMEEANFCVKCADEGTYVGFDDLFDAYVLEPAIAAKADEIIAGASPDAKVDEIIAGASPDAKVDAELDELNALIQALQFFEPPEGEEGFGIVAIDFGEGGSVGLFDSTGTIHAGGEDLLVYLWKLMIATEEAEANADALDE